MPGRLLFTTAVIAFSLVAAAPAGAGSTVRYGIQDDAWLASGAGTLESRLKTLDRLGVKLVRFTIHWDRVAARRPKNPRAHADRAYDWRVPDAVLTGLRQRKIAVVLTVLGAPRWANGGRPSHWAPTRPVDMEAFGFAAAKRYPWVNDWLVWNEPNQRRWLQPTSPAVYTRRVLNPAYTGIKRANRRARVGGGVTAPRAGAGGVSPVSWIRGMRAAGARLDAYAHHPYPERPKVETPWTGGCAHCQTITMATLVRLLREVQRNFGAKRIWLTEYGYQTNPPDRLLGVSPAVQARYIGEGARRAYTAPRVDMLIHYMIRDDGHMPGWQSGLFNRAGTAKPAARAYPFPLAQVARSGTRVAVWGQVRPRTGRRTFRLRVHAGGRTAWAGPVRTTDARGFFTATVAAPKGARIELWSPRERRWSAPLVVR